MEKTMKKPEEFKIPVEQYPDCDQDVSFLRMKDGSEWILAYNQAGHDCTMVSAPQLYDWLKYHYEGVDKKA